MARTTDEIKETLQEQFMNNSTLATAYGFNVGADYWSVVSKVSIENIFLYIVAYCAHVVEVLFDKVQQEINTAIAEERPGTLYWYADKLKNFLYGQTLNELGEYPDDLSEDVVQQSKIVKHAVAVEDSVSGMLVLKVAKDGTVGARVPLNSDEASSLENYISRIKYAGVRTLLINEEGDTFNANVTIYVDPLLNITTVENNCRDAIKQYIQNLPFNGEYSNMALVDALQLVDGCKVIEKTTTSYKPVNESSPITIVDKVRPYAGYFNLGVINLNMKYYE